MPGESGDLSKLLRSADSVAALLERVRAGTAGLPITGGVPLEGGRARPAAARSDELERLADEGYGELRDIETPERCAALVRGIDGVLDAGLPAVFVYLADPLWTLGERLRAELSSSLGHRYRLMADVWAWRIDRGRRGWPPHRGWASALLDRRAPELVNVWVALSDAAVDRSCIHVVPLGEDAGYPDDLESTSARLESVRALPVASGTALFWNANTLHWGGPCSRDARGPRYSCSFSLVRDDAVDLVGWPTVDVAALDARARVDLVASQIVTYGEGKGDIPAALLDWARATTALRLLGARD